MRVRRLGSAAAVAALLLAPGVGLGPSGAAPAQSDVEECNRLAQTRLNPLAPEASSEAPARRSRWPRAKPPAPPPAPFVPDPDDESVRGMHEAGYRNEYYRRAYRECMKDRGASAGAARE